jgi:serine/threonine-protein kinase
MGSTVNTSAIVVLFTDLVGSTRLLTTLGARGPETVGPEHLSALQEYIRASDGTLVKSTGDGVMATFPSAAAAMDCAAALQRHFDGADAQESIGGRVVRIGISAGDARESDGDWFGSCVVEASRLCGMARGGQILAADVVVRLAGPSSPARVVSVGELALAGFPGPINAFEVLWDPVAERPLSVVIADDSVLLRSGIARLLAGNGFRVVAEAGDGEELKRLVDAFEPDLVVADIRMPPTHTLEGIQAAGWIRSRYPNIGIMILSQYLESPAALSLLTEHQRGIGYLLKDRVANVDEFIEALRNVALGGTAIDADVVARLVGRRRVDDPIGELTPRELDVLSLMAAGRSNQAIGENLTLSLRTVESHIASIFSKLGLEVEAEGHRRVQAVVAFLRRP